MKSVFKELNCQMILQTLFQLHKNVTMERLLFAFLCLIVGVCGAPTDDNPKSTIILTDKGPLGLYLQKSGKIMTPSYSAVDF